MDSYFVLIVEVGAINEAILAVGGKPGVQTLAWTVSRSWKAIRCKWSGETERTVPKKNEWWKLSSQAGLSEPPNTLAFLDVSFLKHSVHRLEA